MKSFKLFFLMLLFSKALSAQVNLAETNDFYDNDTTFDLGVPIIEIAGEVANPGKIALLKLPLRSEIVKEALLNEKGDSVFIGAYRYDGYSLYDILNNAILKKKNQAEFSPIIDLYVEIENEKGDKIVLSWGEIYYPLNRNKIIIATKVARIVPSKTKELWNLPKENKLVVATDLLSERNISKPVKITVKSYTCSITAIKEMKDIYSSKIDISKNENSIETITKYPTEFDKTTYSTVFYGRGRGIHGISEFKGITLSNFLKKYVSLSKENLKSGIIVIVGKDGYRGVFTFSEIFNRSDFAEALLIDRSNDKENGAFSLFASFDYFSDRAIKAISEIRILEKY